MRWEVPSMVRQTVLDLSTRLGIPYDEGWRFPLRIRFTDRAGRGAESILAFVGLYQSGNKIHQDLNINLSAYHKHKFDYEKTLAHELVHAMMNDALGGQAAAVFPRWLHEGLAVYGADEGEKLVKAYVHANWGFAKQNILNGLESHNRALDYAEDYLAIKYIVTTHGPNALPLFIQQVIERNGNVAEAYEYATNESWSDFKTRSREFSEQEIDSVKPPRRGKYESPF